MYLVKIRLSETTYSWTVIDDDHNTIEKIRDWIIHLEETNASPNTIAAYARQICRLGSYLKAHDKSFVDISVRDYDQFLQWLPFSLAQEVNSAKVIPLYKAPKRLSPSLVNQIHLATKSFYRYLTGRDPFEKLLSVSSTHHESVSSYQPFLEHINKRRTVKQKDRYHRGDLSKVQHKVMRKRLLPENVLKLVQSCRLIRDAFLIVLLYNTGMRIGEVLGLRHVDIDIAEKVIWVIPRHDNENGARAKGRKTRAIPVMDYVIDMYVDYITSEEYVRAFESGTLYVFCNVLQGRIGRALSKSYSENLKQYLTQRSKIDFTWHQFRHTHASEAIAAGYSLLEIAERLGHANPQTTHDFYKHLFSHEIRKMHLTGPEKLKERLNEFMRLGYVSDKGAKWI